MMGDDDDDASAADEEEHDDNDETTLGDFDSPLGKAGLILCLVVSFVGVGCGYRFVLINLNPNFLGWRARAELRGEYDSQDVRGNSDSMITNV